MAEGSRSFSSKEALKPLNLDHGITPEWEKKHYPNHAKRWTDVITAITTQFSDRDAQSEEEHTRHLVQFSCTAALREQHDWHGDIKINGKFLALIDSAIISARQYNEYYDTDFSSYAAHTVEELIEDPQTSPLLRRKAEAMQKREQYTWPYDPQIIREVLLRFHHWIYLDQIIGLSDILKQNPNYLNQLSDAEILALPKPELTGDEGITEFLWEKTVRALENPTLRKSSDASNLVIAKIAPEKVGAFDTMGRLIGIRDFTESVIHPIEQDPDLVRKDIADDIAFTFDVGMRKQLSNDFGFPIENLTLREQISLIGTFRSITGDEEKRIVSTVKTFGLDGARAFLSTEFGDSFRGTVLSIAEKFSEDDAKGIFKSFSEIVTFAQETAETLGARFFANDKTYNADAVRTELLSRAKELLLTAESSDATSIASKLARFKGDIVLFASMFKVTQKGQEVKFEDIKNVHLESMPSNELTKEDTIAMEKILIENWSKQTPALLKSTLESLQESFANPQSQFFILRKGDDIAASVRFDERDDGSLYAGSLNVNDVYRSAGIGEAMLQSTIDSLAKNHIITAHVPANLPVAMKYVNDFGLKIVGIDEEVTTDGTVIRDLKLERNDEHNRHYGAHLHIERFDISSADDSIINEVQRQASHGQVGTKFFSDPLNPHLLFIAFEPAVILSQERQAA